MKISSLTTSDQERGGDSDRSALPPVYPVSQEAPASAHAPKMERRLTPRHHLRLLFVVVLVLIALAGGYSVFHALTPPSRHASSAFQETHCPFPIAGLVEGQNVICGFLTVPEDRSQPRRPTIRLVVAVFKAPNPHPAPDPVLVLGG